MTYDVDEFLFLFNRPALYTEYSRLSLVSEGDPLGTAATGYIG